MSRLFEYIYEQSKKLDRESLWESSCGSNTDSKPKPKTKKKKVDTDDVSCGGKTRGSSSC